MLEFEVVERIQKQFSFKELKVGDVFTWGAKHDAWVKIDSRQAFCLTTPSNGCSNIEPAIGLVMCEAKLLITGLSTRYKPNPSTGI